MIRYALSTILFLLVFLFETSFLSSLPFPFNVTPFVFGTGVYLLQHQGLKDGLMWIIGFGLLTHMLHTSIFPFPALAFLVGAMVSYLSARHVFSNRSLYGVIGCALSGFVGLLITESSVRFIRSLISSFDADWSVHFVTDGYRIILLVVVIVILYTFAKPIRLLLNP